MQRQRLAILLLITAMLVACSPADSTQPASDDSANGVAAGGGQTSATEAGDDSGSSPQRGGELVYASAADVVSLDPVDGGGTVSTAVRDMIYNYLVQFTPDLQIEPDLAESWEVDEEEWTFQLRDGVTFHDGTPFNAEAVKVHFDRLLEGSHDRSSDWTPFLDNVEVVDDLTVRFTTTFPDSFFLNRLASDSGAIPSPTALEEGVDLAQNPVGTGPFTFVEWTPDVHVVVERNDDYWGDEPLLDRVVIRPIPEAGTRVIALESGDVDLAAQIPPEQLEQLESNAALTLDTRETVRQLFIGMHNLKEPFTDERVRQALNYAVDMESIVDAIYGGLATVIPGAVPSTVPGYAPVETFPYDPDKARELLAEAGYPDGFSVPMIGTNGRYLKDFELQQSILQQLRDVGITADLESVEFAQYIELVRQETESSDLVFWQDAWSASTAAAVLRERYHCDSFVPTGNNLAGYCNPEVDALVEEAEQTIEATERDELLRQAQELIVTDAPSIWGLAINQVAGMNAGVHDVLHMATEVLTVDEHTWVEE